MTDTDATERLPTADTTPPPGDIPENTPPADDAVPSADTLLPEDYVLPSDAIPPAIVPPSAAALPRSVHGVANGLIRDRSSTITVVNDHPTTTLVLKGELTVDSGSVDKWPSKIILPRGATTLRVRDNNGLYGSKGWVSYIMGGDGAEISIFFQSPAMQIFSNKNKVTVAPSDHVIVGDYQSSGPLIAEIRIH